LLAERQSTRFLALYALAWAGGSISYVPFLTVLLPARVAVEAGDAAVGWLAYLSFGGAVAASLANILAGWLSDVTGNRRGWIVAGLGLSAVLLMLFGRVEGLGGLLAVLLAWQVAINMILAPLAAWAGDCVPDAQKGALGGLLSFAPATGALAGVLVTFPGLAGPEARLAIVAGLVVATVLPVILLGRPRQVIIAATPAPVEADAGSPGRRVVARMWLARLLMQIAESALFAYLYLWMRSLDPSFNDASTARLFLAVLAVGVPVALLVGHWSDRAGRPLAPLRAAALLAACGLCVMALAPGVGVALAGYALFSLVMTVFLALHSAQVLRVLPRSERRGRDLGFFNLTNTVPAMVMPWLTLSLVPQLGFTALFGVLAVLALIAARLLAPLSSG
jgi:MFS family permease